MKSIKKLYNSLFVLMSIPYLFIEYSLLRDHRYEEAAIWIVLPVVGIVVIYVLLWYIATIKTIIYDMKNRTSASKTTRRSLTFMK